MDKLDEVRKLLRTKDVDLKSKVKEIKKKYKEDLQDFVYVEKAKTLVDAKKKFIRYVGFDNKINYGGFLLKVEKLNDNFYIYLINKDKKVWNIDFSRNYVFMVDILNNDEKMRKEFEAYLLTQEQT
jgi:hypothetical protein